jgi:DNA-binding transcriptional LysR family regulator
VPLAELADEEWLCGSRPSTCGEVIFAACRSAGFEPRIGFESDDYHVMQGFIAAGLGFTLLPDLALQTLRSDLVVRPTDPPAPQRRVWAATRAEGARSPATDEMLAVLVEVGAAIEKRSTELRIAA